jgi:hypothetical protein
MLYPTMRAARSRRRLRRVLRKTCRLERQEGRGTRIPDKGDPGTTSVSAKSIGKSTIEETDKRDGKVISVARISVSAGGKTMTIAVNDKLHGTTSKFLAEKR